MTDLRATYVMVFRGLRWVLRRIGAMEWLERREGRRARWFRSLFAIYDFEDLISLDLPWWTFDAIDAVEVALAEKPGARVFEWGSGASTVWLAARAGEVISIEHDGECARKVEALLRGTPRCADVTIRHVAPQKRGRIASGKLGFEGQFFDAYVAAIRKEQGDFDLIVIDGRAREACLAEAVSRLAPGGRILVDDFKRARYREAALATGLSMDLKKGLAVCLPLPDSTALLYHPA